MEQNTVQKPDCAAITAQARQAAEELLAVAHLRAGDIFVVGCSSSEIVGGHIGKDSSMEAAAAVLAGILPVLKAQGVYLAAQCCSAVTRASGRRALAPPCCSSPPATTRDRKSVV